MVFLFEGLPFAEEDFRTLFFLLAVFFALALRATFFLPAVFFFTAVFDFVFLVLALVFALAFTFDFFFPDLLVAEVVDFLAELFLAAFFMRRPLAQDSSLNFQILQR